jgi:hypothetical protein
MDDIETLRLQHQRDGATALVIGTVLQMLVEKGILHQGEVIAKLDQLSRELMAQSLSAGATEFIDVVRDMVAGEPQRRPS